MYTYASHTPGRSGPCLRVARVFELPDLIEVGIEQLITPTFLRHFFSFVGIVSVLLEIHSFLSTSATLKERGRHASTNGARQV